MFDKIKNFGSQVAEDAKQAASSAADSITSSVKGGVQSVTNAAVSVGEALNEKAVRSSTAQASNILELAIQELKTRPLSSRPLTLTATVDFQLASVQIQVHMTPDDFARVESKDTKALPAPDQTPGDGAAG